MRKVKISVCAAFAMFIASSLFAAGYKVESFTGKVTYESAPGKWTAVTEGHELSASTVIQTGINSTLVLSMNDAKINIKAMQKGTIESLSSVAAAGNSGIKKGSSIKSSAVAADSKKTSKSVVTASSRASEAKEDFDWEE